MADLIFVAVTVGFFGLTLLFIFGCERLTSSGVKQNVEVSERNATQEQFV